MVAQPDPPKCLTKVGDKVPEMFQPHYSEPITDLVLKRILDEWHKYWESKDTAPDGDKYMECWLDAWSSKDGPGQTWRDEDGNNDKTYGEAWESWKNSVETNGRLPAPFG